MDDLFGVIPRQLLEIVGPLLLYCLVIFALLFLVCSILFECLRFVSVRPVQRRYFTKLGSMGIALALPVGISAMIVGYFAGGTEDAAISTMIPGLLSLVSGAAFLAFHQKLRYALPLSISLVAFFVNLAAGAIVGSLARDAQVTRQQEEIAESTSYQASLSRMLQEVRLTRERLFLEAAAERDVREYRATLGLDPEPPQSE